MKKINFKTLFFGLIPLVFASRVLTPVTSCANLSSKKISKSDASLTDNITYDKLLDARDNLH